jgi:short-subunit dehydrogenase
MHRFQGKTVLITGASQGVGKACAEAFFAEGANLVLVARREGPLNDLAQVLGEPERLLVRPTDVADGEGLAALVQETCERFGALHGIVNNAGAHFRGPVASRTADELSLMVDVNLRAPIVLSRLALPAIQAAGGGFVVNVASLAGKLPLDGASTYSSTKFGLRAFSLAFAEELRGTGVTVSVVSPGPIETGFILDELDDVEDIVFSQTMCTAGYVAGMILDCAADGRRERSFPASGARLATLGYLVPALRRLLRPALVRKGARVKARLKKRLGGGAADGAA